MSGKDVHPAPVVSFRKIPNFISSRRAGLGLPFLAAVAIIAIAPTPAHAACTAPKRRRCGNL